MLQVDITLIFIVILAVNRSVLPQLIISGFGHIGGNMFFVQSGKVFFFLEFTCICRCIEILGKKISRKGLFEEEGPGLLCFYLKLNVLDLSWLAKVLS